jgi:NAD(P)-dependent dehydrogenase (short-subunit alcohol dehydrogenase family)
VPLDVTDAGSIRAAHAVVRRHADGLDLLINNAGMYSTRGSDDPTERLGTLRFEDALLLLRANAVGPLMVAQQYLDLLAAGRVLVTGAGRGLGLEFTRRYLERSCPWT